MPVIAVYVGNGHGTEFPKQTKMACADLFKSRGGGMLRITQPVNFMQYVGGDDKNAH